MPKVKFSRGDEPEQNVVEPVVETKKKRTKKTKVQAPEQVPPPVVETKKKRTKKATPVPIPEAVPEPVSTVEQVKQKRKRKPKNTPEAVVEPVVETVVEPKQKVKTPSAWMVHVRKYREEHPDISWKECLQQAKASYKK